jgi:hypothetical protein
MPHGDADPPRELVAAPQKTAFGMPRDGESPRSACCGRAAAACIIVVHATHVVTATFTCEAFASDVIVPPQTVVKHPAVPSLHPLLSSHQLPSPGPTFHRHGCHSSNTTDAVLPFCDRHRLFKAQATEKCGPAPHASAPRLILPLSELNTSFVPQCWKHHSESSSLLARRWQPNVHVSLDGVQLLRPIR